MGAWGTGSFENDVACDWGNSLEKLGDLASAGLAFDKVIGAAYVDADAASAALAAGEAVARLQGRWGTRDPYSEALDRWVESHPQVPSEALVARSLAAIDRIVGEGSELAELWEDDPAWRVAVAELRERITG